MGKTLRALKYVLPESEVLENLCKALQGRSELVLVTSAV